MIRLDETLMGLSMEDWLVQCTEDVLQGFRFFCKSTMGLDVQDFQLEWVKAFHEESRSLIEAPRQHGKTTILGVAWRIYKMFFNTDENYLTVSHRLEHSTEMLDNVKSYIANSEMLYYRLHPRKMRGGTWTKTVIKTATGCTNSCKPNTHAVCGGTYHDVLADEVSLFKDHDVYFKDIIPTVGTTGGHICLIGTPKTGVDLLATIKELNEQKGGYWYKRYQALIKSEDGTTVPLWPTMYPLEFWKQVKESMTQLDFEREYMCNIVGDKTQAIPMNSVMDAYDNTLYFDKTHQDGVKYYCGSDLARSPEGDFNVHTYVKVDNTGRITIAYIDRTRGMDVDSRADRMNNLYQIYKPERYLADESLDGKAVIKTLINNYNVPIAGFVFTPENRYNIISNLITVFERGRITIPCREGDFYTFEMVQKLSKELSEMIRDLTPTKQPTFKTLGRHDDMVMSLALAIHAIGDNMSTSSFGDYLVADVDTGDGKGLPPLNVEESRDKIVDSWFY